YLVGTLLCTVTAGPVFRLLTYCTTGNELASYILLFGCLDSLALGALLPYYDSKLELDLQKKVFLRYAAIIGAVLFTVQLVLWWGETGKWLNVSFTHLAIS